MGLHKNSGEAAELGRWCPSTPPPAGGPSGIPAAAPTRQPPEAGSSGFRSSLHSRQNVRWSSFVEGTLSKELIDRVRDGGDRPRATGSRGVPFGQYHQDIRFSFREVDDAG